ncbi:hypothetical protein AgCh_001746 [Apium graveolens]
MVTNLKKITEGKSQVKYDTIEDVTRSVPADLSFSFSELHNFPSRCKQRFQEQLLTHMNPDERLYLAHMKIRAGGRDQVFCVFGESDGRDGVSCMALLSYVPWQLGQLEHLTVHLFMQSFQPTNKLDIEAEEERDIVIACIAVHNFIRKKKLEDELFDRCDQASLSDSDGEGDEED